MSMNGPEMENEIRRLGRMVEELSLAADKQPARIARDTGGGGGAGDWGVVREWGDPESLLLDVTLLRAVGITGAISGITIAAAAVVSVSDGHQIKIGYEMGFSGVAGMTAINGLVGTVVGVADTAVTVSIDTQTFDAYEGGGTWRLPKINKWILPSDDRIKIATEPRLPAKKYNLFKYVGNSEDTYPLDLPIGVPPAPIQIFGGVRTVIWNIACHTGFVPAGMPVTEGVLVDGELVVQIAN